MTQYKIIRQAPFLAAVAQAVVLVLVAGCARPTQQSTADALVVAVISDLNSAYGSTSYDAEVTTAISIIRDSRPDLVLVAGDMIAGQRPTLTDDNVRAMWAAFDSVVAAPLRAADIPFAFTLGNHDASGYPSHARDRRLAEEYWKTHTPRLPFEDRARFPRNYSFAMRGVFFGVLDASTGEVGSDSTQMSWLEATFAGRGAREARMRVVLGHVPLHAVAEGRNLPGEVQNQPAIVEAMLNGADVRMYISGHHHAYYPGRRGALQLLHAGAVGSGPRPLLGSSGPPYKSLTLLRFLPALDSIEVRTLRIDGATRTPVDERLLPRRIDGINGAVVRRDLMD